ncbi:MAG: cation:proton antiporter, partial [Oscillospiraceae bacterium]
MQTYNYLLALAIILLSTKIFSLASKKVNMPQVLGALIAGLVLGPSVLGMISESDFIIQTSEIGVIMLMFIAGLDTDLKELKSTGIASAVIAMLGVILPLGGGYLIYNAFFYDVTDELGMLRAIFIGIVLTATSVSITVETLREIGKLNGKVGTAIVGAALIDDILGIIILTITT